MLLVEHKKYSQSKKKNLTDDGGLYVSVVTTQQLLNVYLRRVVFDSVYQKKNTAYKQFVNKLGATMSPKLRGKMRQGNAKRHTHTLTHR